MKPIKTFTLPDSIIEAVGSEWKGTYTVHLLDAEEYLATGEDIVNELRAKGEWTGVMPEAKLKKRIVCKSITFNDKPLEPDAFMPSKLFEVLQAYSVPLNMLSQQEAQDLFLRSSKASPPASVSP